MKKEAKKKRIKRVFSSADQVMHLWANQVQSDARCENVFFKEKSIYSYGLHYELGRLINKNGKTIALINAEKYSKTTAKHQRYAWQAVSHLPRLKCSDFNNIKQALLDTQDNIVSELFNWFNKTSLWTYSKITKNDAPWFFQSVVDFNKACDALNYKKLKIELTKEFIDLMNEHVDACVKRREFSNSPEQLAKKKIEQQKREARKLVKLQQTISDWKQGLTPLTKELRDLKVQLIRVVDDEVQTTKGARVPLADAKRLLIKIMNDAAKPGDKVGDFSVSSLGEGVVKIQCHTISLEDAKKTLLNQ